jgi:hypothetical protein
MGISKIKKLKYKIKEYIDRFFCNMLLSIDYKDTAYISDWYEYVLITSIGAEDEYI